VHVVKKEALRYMGVRGERTRRRWRSSAIAYALDGASRV
jgi:hypothetical protein